MNTENKAKFAYPLAVEGSEQELKDLMSKLIELGYEQNHHSYFYGTWLVTNFSGYNRAIGFALSTPSKYQNNQKPIPASNPDLILALAAMREGTEFYEGESVIFQGETNYAFTKNHLYTIREPLGKYGHLITLLDNVGSQTNGMSAELWRKASKEEIIAHYTKKEKALTEGQNIGGVHKSSNTMKDRKIIGYKLIKEYPGSFKLGHEFKTTQGSLCAQYPEFWQPIYEKEKPETMEGAFGTLGQVVFYRTRELARIFNEDTPIHEIRSRFQYLSKDQSGVLGYSMNIETVKVGCKSGIRVQDVKQMLAAYDKFISE